MKRSLVGVLSLLLAITMLLSGCGGDAVTTDTQSPSSTTAAPNGSADAVDPYAVTEDLLVALHNTTFVAPKNIIYMIGDGMGLNVIEATRELYADKLYDNKLIFDYLDLVCTQSTYSTDQQITDSAAGGTALATGFKTSNGTVAMDPAHTKAYKTVLELAAEKGKSTGIVATKSVTDATPAAFTAHVTDRGLDDSSFQVDIARQQLEKVADGSLDLILGGGSRYYGGKASDAFIAALDAGMSYHSVWKKSAERTLPLVELYAADSMDTYKSSMPSLADMTERALTLLSQDENGFFVMIEASQIDSGGHDNNLSYQTHEVYEFHRAITVAVQFMIEHPDTVLIITADHETGGLYLPKEGGNGTRANYRYTTAGHTCVNVPVYALGYGTEALAGIRENTDIAAFVASLLGESRFGQTSSHTQLYAAGENGGLVHNFDAENFYWDITSASILDNMDRVKHATAVHFTIKNRGTERVLLPKLVIQDASGQLYAALPQYACINGGDTLQVSYTLPTNARADSRLHGAPLLRLVYINEWHQLFDYEYEVAELEIIDIHVTDREPGK